jgi:8-oxo-dGTP pyrophosphatase MutT (NUDIX family)
MTNFVPVALAVIMNAEGKFLLTQRFTPESPEVHLKWQLVGGGIEFGETAEHSMQRECEEEIGQPVEVILPHPSIRTHVWHYTGQPVHMVLISYLCKLKNPLGAIKLDHESCAYNWYTLAEMKTLDMLPNAMEMTQELVELWKRVG